MSRIKTSRHLLKCSNLNKLEDLKVFVSEYRRCLVYFVDFIWDNGYVYNFKGEILEFNLKKNKLSLPSMLDSNITKLSNLDTFLTARALKCCMTQAAGIINAEVEKQKKRLFIFDKSKLEGKSKKQLKLLIKKIKQNIPRKPSCKNVRVELNSICCDFKKSDGEFDGFLRLKSITKTKLDIKLPIKFSRHTLKLSLKGEMMNSFLINENFIDIRWNLQEIKEKTEGSTVGADQGFKDVLTLSDGSVTQKTDMHNHSLESILSKVCRKKKGSKAFLRAKNHQKNFVNWSINQLNFKNIKQINLEKIWNINYKKSISKKLSHWQNTIIRDKIKSKCEDEGVRLTFQSSTYRSQRCSSCGNVRKANRKGKEYSCKNCGNVIDSDLNAAKNHEIQLPEIPYTFRNLNLNRGLGFFWKSDGLFDLEGRSLQSLPHVEK